jgi:hypothetical protein
MDHSDWVLVVGVNNASFDGEGARGRGLTLSHGICIHADKAAGWAYLYCAMGSLAMKTNNMYLSPSLASVSHRDLTGILMRRPTTSSLTAGNDCVLHSIGLASDERTIWMPGRKGEVETDEEADTTGDGGAGRR